MSNNDPTPQPGFSEPVIVAGVVLWLLTQLGAVLVGHTHWIQQSQWDTLVTTLVPIVSAAVIGVITWITRRFVSPAWKVVGGDLSKWGFPVPTDAQLESWANDLWLAFQVKQKTAEAEASNAALPASSSIYANQMPMQAGSNQDPATA